MKQFVNPASLLLLAGLPLLSACTSSTTTAQQELTRSYVVGRPAAPPAGVVRYCWEEPIVAQEPQGPGIEPDGRWYLPSAVVVREVRMGKWRPCRPESSEVTGETRNERE